VLAAAKRFVKEKSSPSKASADFIDGGRAQRRPSNFCASENIAKKNRLR
jgi:hypothetical protein